MNENPHTALEVADRIGRRQIAAAVGVGTTAVSNAVARDMRFPSSWYLILSRLATEAGFTLAPELCGMKRRGDGNITLLVNECNGATDA
jgi:hypothetical protein